MTEEQAPYGDPAKATKQIGVHVNIQLWRKFRATCLEEGVQAGHKLDELIAEYLAKKAGKSFTRTK